MYSPSLSSFFFFFNDTATTEIYTLSLHDALPICRASAVALRSGAPLHVRAESIRAGQAPAAGAGDDGRELADECRHALDRKSTRLNSSHLVISYAVFCLKKKKKCNNMLTISAIHI